MKDYLASHPWVDFVAPIFVGAAWFSWADSLIPASDDTRIQLYVGTSTLAGLTLAAATFVCAMIYQSASPYVELVRRTYSKVLRRNWRAIIGSTLLAALLPLVAVIVDSRSARWSMTLAVGAVTLLVARFVRCLYWLALTLFMEHASETVVPDYVVPEPSQQGA